MKHYLLFCFFPLVVFSQLKEQSSPDSILGHAIQRDEKGNMQAWYKPDIPGSGYVKVVRLASEFIKNAPVYEPLGLPMYFVSCCFQGPHMTENGDFVAEDWMHNPACIWAGLVQGLVLNYRAFSGDTAYINVVRAMLGYQLQHGTTPSDWAWPNVPFASADPYMTEYRGASRWEQDGMRGDGLYGIEPDKIGELGIAYLKFYQVTEEICFLQAAVHCADVLARQVRDVRPGPPPFSAASTEKSPWPFRVNAFTGEVISEYCSNVVEPVRLFDELLRIRGRIGLKAEQADMYKKARDLAWEWLFSINGPMRTYIWNAYFEDIPNDPDRTNRVQITPLETARYLLKHPERDPDPDHTVPALIRWVSSVFATEGMDAIKEQTWCYAPMGSHTARYASLCALWYQRTGDGWYRNQAQRFFNLATYMCFDNGVVSVGPQWPGSWWSDGYGDYIRHFMEGIAAIPEWAPVEENHLLKSTSVVQNIQYKQAVIRYRTFDDHAIEVLRLKDKPVKITVNGNAIREGNELSTECWLWHPMPKGGVLRLRHINGTDIQISFGA
jgi:hypothetical protein